MALLLGGPAGAARPAPAGHVIIPRTGLMRTALAKTYLVLALGCGAIMVFLNPPFQSPDEPNHFFRALAIAEGRWLATQQDGLVGAPMRAAVIRWVFALHDDLPGHPEKKQSAAFLGAHVDADRRDPTRGFADFRNTALYSPVAYLPQALGLAIGRSVGLPMLLAYYLARLFTLASCAALGYWACRQLPCARLTFVLIALSPLFLFQEASLSADGPTYALTAAFTALVLRASSDRSGLPVSGRELAGLSSLGALTALTKLSAAPVPLVALLLLRRPVVRAWRDALIVIGVSWAALLAWSLAVSGLYVPAHPFVHVDARAQLDHVLRHPVQFAGTLWHTLDILWPFYYRSAVGILGWLDTPLRVAYVNGFYLVLVISGAVAEAPAVQVTWRERLLAAVVVVATYGLLSVVMYLTWTAVGADMVDGVQGRYFLPLAVFWAVLCQWPAALQRRLSAPARLAVTTACLAYAVFFLGHAFRTMATRFWQ
jgi:uncharacterized membrane protein